MIIQHYIDTFFSIDGKNIRKQMDTLPRVGEKVYFDDLSDDLPFVAEVSEIIHYLPPLDHVVSVICIHVNDPIKLLYYKNIISKHGS